MAHLKSILIRFQYLIGPLGFFIFFLAPLDITGQQQRFLSIFSLVVGLWIFTKIPLFISGLLGVALSIMMGVVTPRAAFAPFADPIIFLFLSGFLFSRALELTKLDQRLAYKVLGHPWVKVSAKRTVVAFLFLSFVASMWISNTAAVAMLLPLSFGVLKKLERSYGFISEKFNEHFLLALAYSATLGGNVTPIGSPPNVVAIGFLKSLTGIDLGFVQWMILALPFSLILFAYVCYRSIAFVPNDAVEMASQDEAELEIDRELSSAQKNVLYIFYATVFLWVVPSILTAVLPNDSSISIFLKTNFSAAVVGLFFSCLLFLVPLNEEKKILSREHTSQIDWGSLLLFGSGLSLGKILFQTGLAKLFASQISVMSGNLGPVVVILFLIVATIFFTELASNTASANIIIPIVIAFAGESELSPLVCAFAFAIACNSAFMLPVATPPNVIVFGTNRIKKLSMIKTGLVLNLLGALLISLFVVVFVKM